MTNNTIENYTPTQEDFKKAEEILTKEQVEMSDKRANEFKEEPNVLERGQIWMATYPDGTEIGEVVIWSFVETDCNKEDNEEETMIQAFLVNNNTRNATEGCLVLEEQDSPVGKDFFINTHFNARLLRDQLEEYRGYIGDNNARKMHFLAIKSLVGSEIEKEFEGELKTGSVIEYTNDPRIKYLTDSLDIVNLASRQFDQILWEFSEVQEEDEMSLQEDDPYNEDSMIEEILNEENKLYKTRKEIGKKQKRGR